MIDQQGHNALHWATIVGSPRKIELLLGKGSNIDGQTEDGHTALILALLINEHDWKCNQNVLKMLLKNHPGNIKDKNDCTPLHHAVMSDLTTPENLFKEIFQTFPADVNVQDDEGDTPLMVALFSKSSAKVRELLPCSDVNVKNEAGYTALHYAATWKNVPVDLFNAIIDKSADINRLIP